MVAPTVRGAELSAVLRSQMSPERVAYHVTLPSGATLQAADGGALITRGGKVLARVSEPTAQDAQGVAVPVSMAVSGDDLVLTVALRGRSVDYPILVDPEFILITKSSEHWTFYGGKGTPPGEGQSMTAEQSGTYPEEEPCYAGRNSCGTVFSGAEWVWEIESPFHPADIPVNFSAEFDNNSFTGSTSPEYPEDARWFLEAGCSPEYHYGLRRTLGEPPPPADATVTALCPPFSARKRGVFVGVAVGQYHAVGAGEYVPQVKANAFISVESVLVSESLPSTAPYEEPGSEAYGPANEGEPQRHDCYLGEAVNCATGDRVTSQTDLEVGGRGPGLELTRTYNSQLAVAQAERERHGPFGYGWTSSYSAHLAFGVGQAFVRQDDGSTVSFVEGEGGHFTPVGSLVQATLERVGSNYLYTLPDQTVLTFNEEGVLTSETDRNGNTITLIYEKVSCSERGQADAFVHTDATGGGGEECPRLAAIEDAAGRRITLTYNEQGLVETAIDPMGHKVRYEYSEENLTGVTEPGESTQNWQFKYDSSHQLTSQTEAPEHTTTIEYDGAHQVMAEVDPMKRTRKWKYTTLESGSETAITEPNGSETLMKANKTDLLISITRANGSTIAATTKYEYNSDDDLVKEADPNGHATEYGYNASGDRTSEKDANGNETKWEYDSTHDVISMTTPKGETTTIKRDSHGNAEVVERPAPGGKTQKTAYKYDSHGDVESMTNPLERTWKYEYDSYGDRKGETDPEGNKRTLEYNEDSQEVATTSPRGNVVGAEPAKFTTKIERDARGRPVARTEPEINEVKPTDKVQATISGAAQEGQTLTAGTGIWEGTPSLSYAYKWEYCNASGGSCSSISGATSATYALRSAYVGDTLRVVVTATNSAGSGSSTSAATVVVTSAVPVFASLFGSKGTGTGQFSHPAYDAIDAHGDVWVSDFEDSRLEEFSASGAFIEAVGFGVSNGEEKLQICTSSCRAGIAGSGSGQMSGPAGIAIAGGDVYVADYSNDRIDEFNEKGEYVSSFGSKGSGADQLEGPISVAVGAADEVWVGDRGNGRLAEFSSSGTFIEALGVGVSNGEEELQTCTSSCRAGTSGSGNGEFSTLAGIATPGSDIYVSDHGNNRVEEFNEKSEYVAEFGTKGTGNGEFEGPEGIAVSPATGSLLVADSGDGRVEEFTMAGSYLAQFGTSGTGNGQLNGPEGLAVNPSGDIYVVDGGNNRIEEWAPILPAPVYTSQFGAKGSGAGQFAGGTGDTVDAHGDVWVNDYANNRVEEFSASGSFIDAIGWGVSNGESKFEVCTSSCKAGKAGSGSGQFDAPVSVAVSGGDVYVANFVSDRVEEFTEKNEYVASFGSKGTGAGELEGPVSVTINPSGDVWVGELYNHRVSEFGASGTFIETLGYGVSNGEAELEVCTSGCKAGIEGAGAGQFAAVRGIAFVGSNLFVADAKNDRLVELNEKGEYVTEFGVKGTGNGQFQSPDGVATDPTSGNLYVADLENNRVQEFTASGTYLAQFGVKGSGNGQFKAPENVAVNSSGDVYVADSGNYRNQEWRPAGAPYNTAVPAVSGELLVGQTLSASTGNWSAVPSSSYTHQWQHCNSSGESCSNVSGATSATYSLGRADVGYTLRVVVTATNSGGSAESTSAATGVIPRPLATEYVYSADGDTEAQTDPNGNTTKYTYNADSQLTKTEEPSKAATETEYDAMGQVTAQTDGNKHTTEYERNLLEETTEESNPLGRKVKKEYDTAGNLVKLTDPTGRTTTYTYDPANRLTEVVYSSGNPSAVKYEYNKDGDRTKMTDGTGTTQYAYDQLDRLTETEDGYKEVVKYEYNLGNQQMKITYPNGKAVARAYDKDGRLEKVTDWNSKATKFSYNQDSDLGKTTFPSETKDEDTYAYNHADQMSEVKMKRSSETLASLVYTRDNDGQVKTTTSKGLPGEEKPSYEYDANSRLTKGAGVAYEYDAANNPTKLGTGTYKYNSGNELETGPSLTYSYNEEGQRTKTTPATGPAASYGYDQAGNLTSVERPKEGEVAEIKDSYAYNGDGLRVSQTISGGTSYLVWDTAEELPLLLSDGTNSYIYGPGGLPIEQISSGGTTSYLHHDQQGSTRLLTGSTGTVTGKCTYGAYGVPTCEGATTTPLGYDAQYTSSDTGLIYLRARTYDPATAQFISVDPEVKQTRTPYSYAGDDPIDRADPMGKDSPTAEEIAFVNGYTQVRNAVERTLRGNKREEFAAVANYYYFAIKTEIAANDENLSYAAYDKSQYQIFYSELSREIFTEFSPLIKAETTFGWSGVIKDFIELAKKSYHVRVILHWSSLMSGA